MAADSRRILITTVGSAGDVHPYIAIGDELRRRGHEVVFLANPHFERRIRDAGLAFEPLGVEQEYIDAVLDPRLVHPRQGPAFVVRELVGNAAEPTFRRCEELIRDFRPHVLLRHIISFGSRWAAEKAGVPSVVASLSPLFWFSPIDRPRFGRLPTDRLPSFVWRLRMNVGRRVLRRLVDGPMNQLRGSLGLPPERDIFRRECLTGAAALGLWSPHFRGPLPDDPPNGTIGGFCIHDRAGDHEEAPAEIERFLAECERDRRPPIVFTFGTSVVHHAQDIYPMAAEACRILGRTGLLLTGKPEYAPSPLPPGVRAFTYAPYSAVLPRGAATVHHGGVGTTAAGLRSGRPTVIIPFANDEFDNANRAAKLGTSITLSKRGLSPRRLAAALTRALDPRVTAAAAQTAERLRPENGAAAAADSLERVMQAEARAPQH